MPTATDNEMLTVVLCEFHKYRMQSGRAGMQAEDLLLYLWEDFPAIRRELHTYGRRLLDERSKQNRKDVEP